MELKQLSVCVRLRRPMASFVAVPVDAGLMNEAGLDVDKLMARAKELGLDPRVQWVADGDVDLNPVQTPVPEGVEVFSRESGA